MDVKIAKLRSGSFFPSLLERLNREVKRRTDGWGFTPTRGVLGLPTYVLIETLAE